MQIKSLAQHPGIVAQQKVMKYQMQNNTARLQMEREEREREREKETKRCNHMHQMNLNQHLFNETEERVGEVGE